MGDVYMAKLAEQAGSPTAPVRPRRTFTLTSPPLLINKHQKSALAGRAVRGDAEMGEYMKKVAVA